jgi:hypothetical protein
MNNPRTFQVTCWPESGSDDNPLYRNYEVKARHSVDAKNMADQEHTSMDLPQERRHMVTPVENE